MLRRLIGYDRYRTRAAFLALTAVHELLRPYVNFFQPIRKLVSKERHGARVLKRYDRAQTPAAGCSPVGSLPQRVGTRSPRSITGSIPGSCAPTWKPACRRSGNLPSGQRGVSHEYREGPTPPHPHAAAACQTRKTRTDGG